MSVRSRTTKAGKAYDVRLRGPGGREVSRTFRTKREAVEYEAGLRTSRAKGEWVDRRASDVTVAELAAEWLKSNPAKRQSTRARDTSALRTHVLPLFGSQAVGALTPTDIRGIVRSWTDKGMAPRTVRRTYGTLRALLNFAVETDRLVRTPCRAIRLPAVEPKAVRAITADDLQRLAAEVHVEYRAMVWLGAVLGLRWGEVAGLRVGRVDLLRRTVSITEQVTRGLGGVGFTAPPKSSAGRPTLTVPTPLVDVLSAHMAMLGLTAADAEAFLFSSRDAPLDYSGWRRRVWLPAVGNAGLPGLGFHDLRRANATAMVLDGVDVKTAQTRLGHSDPRLTLAIYAQATHEGDRKAADRLGARFMSTPNLDSDRAVE